MVGLRAGDESAWRELFYRHYPVMCYVAESYLHDSYLAEAVAQDVMVHLWENRSHLSIHTSLRSYLLQSVRNRSLDFIKVRGRRKDTDRIGPDSAEAFHNEQPLSKILEQELEQSLSRSVDALPEESRIVFKKSRLEGLKYHEIAQELGISVNTVKYHMKRALALLREEFSKYLALLLFFFMN